MTRPIQECTFTTHDGVALFYRYWPATVEKPRGAIVLFHRGHEHSGRVSHLPDELNLPEFAFFAWDARGHGHSPGPRGYSPSFATSIRDVQTFIDHIVQQYGVAIADVAIIAQSVGAVLAAAWAHDYAPKVRCMVLASPAFKVKLYVPLARPGLKLMQALRGNFFVNSYVKAKFLTHDPARIDSYNSDPLISRPISVNILLDLYKTAERIITDAQAIQIPTQLLISADDWVVHHAPQYKFYERLGSLTKEKHLLPGFYHDTLGEKDRHIAIAQARNFIERLFARPIERPSLLEAHLCGFTRCEADALAAPLSPLSPRGLYWGMTRFWLKVGGLLSEGIRLGHATGFDSGSTLDYVYRNQPAGFTPFGKLVDWFYLHSIGWRGIRQRKRHIEELLRATIARVAGTGEPVRIVDIAAGHGRYVLEALDNPAIRPESILLRDYSDINVRDGQALVRARGFEDIAHFVKADAFDRDSLARLAPQPNIAIVSGLYELFADNDLVRRSLEGLAAAIPVGGYLIYTNQPWHPQLELIARALTSHREGRAWVMRRRTQAEMDQLVEAAGFRKLEQRIDEWGIFTVSVAQRIG